MVAKDAMEIWDAMTIKPLCTFQSSGVITEFRRGVAYSPDCHSLASCSNKAIVIWDTQTGGEVTRVECKIPSEGLELVWSLDGKIIGAISSRVSETFTVYTYNILMGKMMLSDTLQSKDKPCIWAHKEAFQIMTTTAWDSKGCKVNIFEAGHTLYKVKAFSLSSFSSVGAFSPTTYQVSTCYQDTKNNYTLLVLDISNSEILLQEEGPYRYLNFSGDGNFFSASNVTGDHLFVWKYFSGHYVHWREFQQIPAPIKFSPNSSLILSCAGSLLHVLHTDFPPVTPAAKSVSTKSKNPKDAYPPGGGYIATTYRGDSTIMITNLCSKTPSSQFIDTGLEIKEIILTGNVLLVKDHKTLVAWLLTKEGVVSGASGNGRADANDSLWTISSQDLVPPNPPSQGGNSSFWARFLNREQTEVIDDEYLEFSVGNGVATIFNRSTASIHTYHLETGEILKLDKVPQHPKRYDFYHPHRDNCDLYHRDLAKQHKPPQGSWPVSQATLQDGWVKDPEGKCRLWLHPRWRGTENVADWFDDVTVLRIKNQSELIVIKL